MDTIVGKRNGKESVILTLIERKTRCQLLFDNGLFWDCPQRLANLFLQFTVIKQRFLI